MSEHLSDTSYLDPGLLEQLGDLEVIAREVVEGLRVGSHRSPLKGFSTEFAHHRQYAPGDPMRTLDWRVFGRTDRYYTKLFEAETNFDCHLLIDASSSMTYRSGTVSKLEYAKFLSAALAYLVLKQRDSIGLSVFDAEVRAYLPPKSSRSIILEIDRLLRDIKPSPKTSLAKQLHDVAMMMRRRSVVVVISDLLSDVEDILAGLEHLRHDGHNVIVFHTLDPYEIDFPFDGTWRFEGLEGEEPLTTQPQRIRDEYLAEFNQYRDALQDGCVRANIDYTLVNTTRPLDQLLSEFFNDRETLNGGGTTARP